MSLALSPSLTKPSIPGDLAMWCFILAELAVFALLFLVWLIFRHQQPLLFSNGQDLLHPWLGVINTLALLSGSYAVAMAMELQQTQPRPKQAAAWLLGAWLCGLAYCLLKGWEYQQLWRQGWQLDSNAFFSSYYLLTAFHLLHVILGMLILAWMAWHLYADHADSNHNQGLQSGASYWHMVDLVWLILFPLVYLL
ncbi:cytochrome c oxidase subunit 3 [Balneatrix alpica]|uniref:cytochrome c oxidase subunit 3 n=1 Tax=Balneatrix alpica TaxID=75684 RepID=UPI0027381A36|nr:cytochrome c oxidase subunit 3 [Balneatrix alpica]